MALVLGHFSDTYPIPVIMPLALFQPRAYWGPRLARDGQRLAFYTATRGGTRAWIADLRSGTATPITDEGSVYSPVWSPTWSPRSSATSSAAWSAPVWPPETIFSRRITGERPKGTAAEDREFMPQHDDFEVPIGRTNAGPRTEAP